MKKLLINKLATYTLLMGLTLPTQSYGIWPFGGDKKEKQKQEQVDETRREKTIEYLEKEGARPLPKMVIPAVLQDDSTFTAPMYGIVNILKPYLSEEQKELATNDVTKAEINLSRNREELTYIASSDSVTADIYAAYDTPRTNIYPDQELPFFYDYYRQIFEKAGKGDTTAIRLKEQLDPYFTQLENNARTINQVRQSLDEAISPIEKKANKSWGERYWWIITPPVVAAVAGTAAYLIGNNGKGGKEKVYNTGDWTNNTH